MWMTVAAASIALAAWSVGADAQPANAAQLRAQIQSAPATRVIPTTPRPATPSAPQGSATKPAPAAPAGDSMYVKKLPSELEAASAALIRERLTQPAGQPTRSIGGSGDRLLAVLPHVVEVPSPSSGRPLILRAVVLLDEPLRFDADRKRFRGRLQLGVVELEASGIVQNLPAPIDFQVFGVTATPNPLSARHTAPPFESVVLEVTDPGDATVRARVRTILDPDKDEEIGVPVDRPDMSVSVSPAVIQGWGLETAVLTVQTREPGFAQQPLQLASRIGRLEDNRVRLDEHGTASQVLRSASIGTDTISVRGGPFGETRVDIKYTLPVRFMVAAALGGLAGGLLRLGRRVRMSSGSARDLGLAILTGAVVFGMYALGVNLTGFRLPAQAGEVLVFVVAAIGAFLGTRLLTAPAQLARSRGADA
jgi:hypothetical protein